MAKQTGLGRGFDSLIPSEVIQHYNTDAANLSVIEVPVSDIRANTWQPRKEFDPAALEDLRDSIAEHGVIQPLIVTKETDGYQLIAGERRLRASKLAKLSTVPVIVRSADEQQKLEIALIENIQRDDLKILETALGYYQLLHEFSVPSDIVAKRVGRSVSSVRNIVRLLSLPEDAKAALNNDQISEGHARQLLALKKPAKQTEVLQMIIKNGWSVRQTEQFVKKYKEQGAVKDEAIRRTQSSTPLTKQLSKKLGAKVTVKNTANGGAILIHFKNEDELSALEQQLLT